MKSLVRIYNLTIIKILLIFKMLVIIMKVLLPVKYHLNKKEVNIVYDNLSIVYRRNNKFY